VLFCVRNGLQQNGLKRQFFGMRNGPVTPKEEGFAKQTQVVLLGGLSANDATVEAYLVSIKLESLLTCYS
jgi:hypothetical protein